MTVSAPPMAQLKRWKMWILTCLAIYPIITLFGYFLQAVTPRLPMFARFLIMVPVAVALLIFLVMPALTKLFRAWLIR
jgi:antibiotic biosynthesis monooxygenase (ABM) superfamily enzyme